MQKEATIEPLATSADEPLMTATQLAAYLGVSKIWVYKHRDNLPHIRVGTKMLRYRKSEIDNALADNTIMLKDDEVKEW